ncbi:MAG: mycothiol conjugate amidase Mca [Trueperella sp.]|nr:mycothiol conjugate amidase Mca [Trueperella sp.]
MISEVETGLAAPERRLMAVHAHPDDEASKGAGMSAKYAKTGRVRIVTLTGGERGDILNPALQADTEIAQHIARVRRSEMAAAAAALGVEHVWLGFEDSGFPTGDPLPPLPAGSFATVPIGEPVRELVRQIREFRPQVLTTYDEQGGYPHPDHIRAHIVSMMAVAAASDAQAYPECGDPWQVSKVYYDISFTTPRIMALQEAMLAAGLESPFGGWLERHKKYDSDRGFTRVADARIDVAEFFPQRDAALRAHATQIDPDGFFFAVPRDLEAKVWPWEEFELALSTVGRPEPGQIEHDLFERIPGL